MDVIRIFDVAINNETMESALDRICSWMASDSEPRKVFFVNAHNMNVSRRDPRYLHALHNADFVLADGKGLELAGRMLNSPVRDNVNGTDMFPLLCERMQAKGFSMYLLGGREEDLPRLRSWIATEFPALRITGAHNGYFGSDDAAAIVENINNSEADLVLIALGCPKQELWIHEHAVDTTASVLLGVGGLFDFYSGRRRRAPKFIRATGFEWVYRMAQEPRRLASRYVLGNPAFLWHVARQALGKEHRSGRPAA